MADEQARYREIKRILWVILFLNLAVAAAKYLYGLATRSVSMQADGIASAFDMVSNLVGLVGIAAAARPADTGHPYGHAKFETYASVAIGVMLVFAAYNVFSDAFAALSAGVHDVTVDAGSYGVMLATLAVNLGVSRYERRAGARLSSEILTADALHTASDALVSVSVIVGLVLVQAGWPVADPIVSMVVGVAILHSAWEVFSQANATLSDKSRLPADEVAAVAASVEGVRDVHRVRTRGTEGAVLVDLHVLLDPETPLYRAHLTGNDVERAIRERFPQVADVVVHIEPDTYRERLEAQTSMVPAQNQSPGPTPRSRENPR
jgi:cation diffusion facilitator family transporter